MSSKFFRSQGPLLAACLALSTDALAAGFAAAISPARFELRAQPGQILRDTVSIINPTDAEADYQFRTTDWRLNDASGIDFLEHELADGSCRPWVRLERRAVRINAGAQKNYRFEVHVPENAEPGLCRFAILIEPAEAAVASVGAGNFDMPIVGRYAVITYVTIGDAAADIEYLGLSAKPVNGERLPTLTLRNRGNAHDRAFGQVTATGRDGRRISLVPSAFPVLPGRTEEISLTPERLTARSERVSLTYPLSLQGQIEIGDLTIRVDEVLE